MWCGVVRRAIVLLESSVSTFWVRARVARSRFEVAALGSRAGCTSAARLQCRLDNWNVLCGDERVGVGVEYGYLGGLVVRRLPV